jgi:hypothetical protein
VQSVDGGLPRSITPENVNFSDTDPLAISPDGNSVAVAGLDGKIALFPLDEGAPPRTVPMLTDGLIPLRWCPDNSLMVYRVGEVPVKILQVNIRKGEQVLWRQLAPVGAGSIRVGADCQSSGYSVPNISSELWIASGLH